MPETYKAAMAACDSVLQGVDMLMEEKEGQSFSACFGLVRPPGHHSGMKSQPHGFSFFNNLAIGVNHALDLLPKQKRRIAIIDWDVHHG